MIKSEKKSDMELRIEIVNWKRRCTGDEQEIDGSGMGFGDRLVILTMNEMPRTSTFLKFKGLVPSSRQRTVRFLTIARPIFRVIPGIGRFDRGFKRADSTERRKILEHRQGES